MEFFLPNYNFECVNWFEIRNNMHKLLDNFIKI